MALLSLRDVSVTYHAGGKDVHAVNHVSLEVERGESLGIVGESGSGKTTLIMAVLRLLPPGRAAVTGQALLDGRDIFQMSPQDLAAVRWEDMAVVFQKAMNALSPVHRIGRFLSDIYLRHRPKATRAEAKEAVIGMLELVNLPPRVFQLYPHELSGGMMQRVSIAMSLLFHPKLLIMDEATAALDNQTAFAVTDAILHLDGLTRVVVTHRLDEALMSQYDEIIVMRNGKIQERGSFGQLMEQKGIFYSLCTLAA